MKYIKALNQDLSYINDDNYIERYLEYQFKREGYSQLVDTTGDITFDNSILINYDREHFEENNSTYKYKLSYNYNRLSSLYNTTINFLDICYLDRTGEIYITNEIIPKDRGYIPMAICCIPGGFFFNYGTTNNEYDCINKPCSAPRFVSCYGSSLFEIQNVGSNFINSLISTSNTSLLVKFKRACCDYNDDTYPSEGCTFNDSTHGDAYAIIQTNKKLNINDKYSVVNNISNSDYNYVDSNNYTIIFNTNMDEHNHGSSYSDDQMNLYFQKDYYGFENTILLNEANESDILENFSPCNSICKKKIVWYIPSIVECVYIYMHIQEIRDICNALCEEYGFYEYDMFKSDIDIYSSSIIWEYNSNVRLIPTVNKHGVIINKKNGLISSSNITDNILINTYPMFQI